MCKTWIDIQPGSTVVEVTSVVVVVGLVVATSDG